MTNEEIEHMWKVASNDPHHDFNWFDPVVVKFAKLVAEKEREACAKIADSWNKNVVWENKMLSSNIAKEIRARGKE
jgi:hypothetical protein